MDLIEKILDRVRDIPTLPTVYSALCDVIANPRSTAEEVAKVISMDQTSTIKVLRIANSAFFGFSGRIENIPRAIVILGFDEVRNLILASSVMNLFNKHKALYSFRPQGFWSHSIAVALITRALGKMIGIVNLENFFVAGILHDIGKLFFFELAEKEYAKVLNLVNKKKCSIREAELEVLGVDHSLAGSMVAVQWRLPDPIRNAIHYHHFGMIGEKADPFVACIHLGDILARALELGFPGDELLIQPNECIWNVLKIRPGMIKKIVPKILKDYKETIGSMFLG